MGLHYGQCCPRQGSLLLYALIWLLLRLVLVLVQRLVLFNYIPNRKFLCVTHQCQCQSYGQSLGTVLGYGQCYDQCTVNATASSAVCAMVSAIKDREGSPPPRCAIITPGRIVHSRYREIASSSLIYSPTYFPEARFSDRRPQFKHLKGRTRHPI